MGPIRVEAAGLPEGVSIAGGDIPAEIPDPNNRATSRRAMLSLTAKPGVQVACTRKSDCGRSHLPNRTARSHARQAESDTPSVFRERPRKALSTAKGR